MKKDLNHPHYFLKRHIGPKEKDIQDMLKTLSAGSLEELCKQTIPGPIQLNHSLSVHEGMTEPECLAHVVKLSKETQLGKNFIGQGYYGTHTPSVILRNVLENPGWYTPYTPYQAEIAQGRLESLFYFQTMVSELTGLPVANASLLDEATAAAEAMTLMFRSQEGKKTLWVSSGCFKQTLSVLKTRASGLGITLKPIEKLTQENDCKDVFGVILQYPDAYGHVQDHEPFIKYCHDNGIWVAMGTDLLALSYLEPPKGIDIAFGNTQRFGVPMGFGGPHAAFFSVKAELSRKLPGRIIGESVDADGNKAYRMALQTREQHIRREKATSNICTAQALLANMAAFFSIYHGPEGLRAIACEVHSKAKGLAEGLKRLGYPLLSDCFFDTLSICVSENEKSKFKNAFEKENIHLFYHHDNLISLSIDETTTQEEIQALTTLFATLKNHPPLEITTDHGSHPFKRVSPFLRQSVFNTYHSETEMMRYLKRLENKDLALNHSMIPLGSCTMKLNAATEMMAIGLPEFSRPHPFTPLSCCRGYQHVIEFLESALAKITGFFATSLQPNSGAQGEYAGLMVIKHYLKSKSKNQQHRDIALIPSSAHGTNPASAVMAGMTVVLVNCNQEGCIDFADFKEKVEKYRDQLAVVMITYPSTYGIFEEDIQKVCKLTHEAGGQVYMDGANLNAQVGLTSPGLIGADVCHINLHKTFAIPHGGGGPGMGPICVAAHLKDFLPKSPLEDDKLAISASEFGSANILLISYVYILLLGNEGLKKASQVAILNANYIKHRLDPYYSILFSSGKNKRVAHEIIVDLRPFKKEFKIEAEDVAKRLIDYGFHAPTLSWPVPGTLMIEPTESESKEELDRFCDALIAIQKEIVSITDLQNNILKNAPHTLSMVTATNWPYAYTREEAVFPLDFLKNNKFWPSVRRVDQAYGDRHFICTCTTDY